MFHVHFQEKHLQDALKAPVLEPSEIPVPDNIIEIDENIYNKMYPKISLKLFKSRIVTPRKFSVSKMKLSYERSHLQLM